MKIQQKVVKALYNDKGQPKDTPTSLIRSPPPLELVSEEISKDELEKRKKSSFTLKVNPELENSTEYKYSVYHVNGTEGLRLMIVWMKDMEKVIKGLRIESPEAMISLVADRCEGSALHAFNEALVQVKETKRAAIAAAVAEVEARPAATHAARQQAAREAAEANNPLVYADVQTCMRAVISQAAPLKALVKQKRYMRKFMRKPRDMKIRQYMHHLYNIINEELPYLPPFAGDSQKLNKDEVVEIILNACPASWTNEMERQNFDTEDHTINEIVAFCERIETQEPARTPTSKPNNSHDNARKKVKFAGKAKDNGSGKWCTYHETDTHDTADCRTLQAQKKKNKDGKPPYKNKTWKRKADDEKAYTQQEVNALLKKVVEKEKKNWDKQAAKRDAEEANLLDDNGNNETAKAQNTVDVDDLDSQFYDLELATNQDGASSVESDTNMVDDKFDFDI